ELEEKLAISSSQIVVEPPKATTLQQPPTPPGGWPPKKKKQASQAAARSGTHDSAAVGRSHSPASTSRVRAPTSKAKAGTESVGQVLNHNAELKRKRQAGRVLPEDDDEDSVDGSDGERPLAGTKTASGSAAATSKKGKAPQQLGTTDLKPSAHLLCHFHLLGDVCGTVRLQAMDNSHVALTAIELRAEGFQPYRCDRPMSIGVSLANLTEVVKTAEVQQPDDTATAASADPTAQPTTSAEASHPREQDIPTVQPESSQLNVQARENAGTKEADPDKQSDAVTVQPAPAPTSSSATAQIALETQTAPASVPTQESSAPVNQAAPSSEPTSADVEMQEAQPGIMHKYSCLPRLIRLPSRTLRRLQEALKKSKDLITDANFDRNEDGIRLQAMDNSHIALTAIEPRAEGFQPYRCDRPMSIGVSLANLTKVFKTGGNDDTLTIRKDDDGDPLNLLFEASKSDRVLEYELMLMDIDSEHLGIPDTQYDAVIRMSSSEFSRIVRDLGSLSESVSIDVSKEGVTFAAQGEIGNARLTLKQGSATSSAFKLDDDEDEERDEDDEEEEVKPKGRKRKRAGEGSSKGGSGGSDGEVPVSIDLQQNVNLTFSL
ncbi:proliferating cell nuclear antigen, partial [Tilletia horrida]